VTQLVAIVRVLIVEEKAVRNEKDELTPG